MSACGQLGSYWATVLCLQEVDAVDFNGKRSLPVMLGDATGTRCARRSNDGPVGVPDGGPWWPRMGPRRSPRGSETPQTLNPNHNSDPNPNPNLRGSIDPAGIRGLSDGRGHTTPGESVQLDGSQPGHRPRAPLSPFPGGEERGGRWGGSLIPVTVHFGDVGGTPP